MAKTFDEFILERRATMGPEGREAERIFRAAYAFGQAIHSARKARNLRQSDLAERSGIAQADISRIERGQIAPTTPTLLKLTDALGVEIQFVLTEPDSASTESVTFRAAVAG